MKQHVAGNGMMALCGLALALTVVVPARAHADSLIGTGVVGAAVRMGPAQNVQVVSGDEQTGEAIANGSTGTVVAELYNNTYVLLTPDEQHTIATLRQASPERTDIFAGTIPYGDMAGAQITTQFLGMMDDIHSVDWVDVQWNGTEVQWYAVATTISYHLPG